MMADLVLDVFTHEGAGGNPLAVRILDEPLESREMMAEAAARESRETAFIRPPPAGGGSCRVDVFTARRQIPFSGHAALGAAWAAREHLLPGSPDGVELAMALGDVDVRFEDGTAWLTAPTIELGSAWPAAEVRATLGLRGPAPDGLEPPRLAGAGLPILIVPVAGLEELHACHLDAAAFRAFGVRMVRHRALHARVYAFCRETRSAENHLSARLFLPGDEDALEDPASGGAAACLGACLSVSGGLDPGGELRVEQGFEMGRPSLLRLRAGSRGGIEVGGQVRPAPGGLA